MKMIIIVALMAFLALTATAAPALGGGGYLEEKLEKAKQIHQCLVENKENLDAAAIRKCVLTAVGEQAFGKECVENTWWFC